MTPITHNRLLNAAVAGLGVVMLLAACARDPEGETSAAATRPAGEMPEQQIFDYRLIESNAGVKQWVLQSAEMQKFSGQRDMILVDVDMDFYRDGVHFSTLTADSGRANPHTKNVHTWGDVVVVTDDGRQLETEELFFSDETELIHNDVFNRFTRQTDVMTGIGLEATPDLEYIELKKDVKAEVTDSSQSGEPQADGPEWTATDAEGGQP